MPKRKTDERDRIAFRAQDMMADITARVITKDDSPGLIAKRDLERYYAMLRRALENQSLSEEEARAIAEALDGEEFDYHSFQLFWATVDDAVRRGKIKNAESFAALSVRLRALSACQKLAIVDGVERLKGDTSLKNLQKVGLVREPMDRTEE